MSDFDSVRSGLTGLFQPAWLALHPTVPLDLPNLAVIDYNGQLTPFLGVKITYRDAKQVSLGSTPRSRYWGELIIYPHVRANTGTKVCWDFVTDIVNILKYQSVSGVQLQVPRILPEQENESWYWVPVSTSFRFDL